MKIKIKQNNKGFTLIELLVVIAIIGLLSTLAVVSLNNARTKARDAKRTSDIKSIQTALELFYVDNDAYPAGTALELGEGTSCSSGACTVLSNATAGFETTLTGTVTYMGLIPRDPSSDGTASPCTIASTGTCSYSYTVNSTHGYELFFHLEGTAGDLVGPDAFCATSNGIAAACQ